jgi:hypothetical protein
LLLQRGKAKPWTSPQPSLICVCDFGSCNPFLSFPPHTINLVSSIIKKRDLPSSTSGMRCVPSSFIPCMQGNSTIRFRIFLS